MLAGALAYHRGALRASLRAEYQGDLDDPRMGAWALADLVNWLPAGCALWRSTGGPAAWTVEEHWHARVELRLRELLWSKTEDGKANRNAPEITPYPRYAHEQRDEEQRLMTRAQRWRQKQMERHGGD